MTSWPEDFFVAPAVLGGVTPSMTVAQEEIFGPVASLMRFDTDDEAVGSRTTPTTG